MDKKQNTIALPFTLNYALLVIFLFYKYVCISF